MRQTILTIDDDPVVRKLVNKAVQGMGYNSIEVSSGLEGLHYLEKHSVQLILLDIMMPILDGFEVLKKIKKHREWRAIPLMMFSAVSDEHKVKEALDMGANNYILKPFRLRTIQEKIVDVLENESKKNANNSPTPKKRKVLPDSVMLVTLNSSIQDQFNKLLRKHSIKILHAKGAIEGLLLLQSSSPDIIIIDKNLRVFSGEEFETKVRNNPLWNQIPTIGLSDSPGDFENIISPSGTDQNIIQTILNLWQRTQTESMDVKSEELAEESNYRLLFLGKSADTVKWFQQGTKGAFEVQIVETEAQLVGDLLTWQPDFVVINYPDYEDKIFEIIKQGQETLLGQNIPYFLFSQEEIPKTTLHKIKSSAIQDVIQIAGDDSNLLNLLDDKLGVNLVDEQNEPDLVVLKRKSADNPVAGREMIHRVMKNIQREQTNFVLDFSEVTKMSFEEIQYLGRIVNNRTRLGIKVCVVANAQQVINSFNTFEETRGVKIFQTFPEAYDYLK